MMSKSKQSSIPIVQQGTAPVRLEPLVLSTEPYVPADAPTLDLKTGDLAGRNELRTSSYTIYVDLPGHPDEMLLVHGYTGAYDRVSKQVATYLRSLETDHTPQPLYGSWVSEPAANGEVARPSDEAMAILEKRGYLVPLTLEEEEALFVKVATLHHHAAIRRAPSYVLMPTYRCNLRCAYCFQDHMRTDPHYGHLLQVMDRPMADRILRGMDAIDTAHGNPANGQGERSILFFGGEPLLAETRPIVEYLIERTRADHKARFSAVTNGTELDAYRDLLGRELISELQITLDGPPAEHDRRRVYPDGSGSFARIAENITLALDREVRVNVRMNIDRRNIVKLPFLADEFIARGWADRPNFTASVAPVQDCDGQLEPGTTFNSWQLNRMLDEMQQQFPRMERISLFNDQLQQQASQIFQGNSNTIPSFQAAFCGAHSDMYIIDAFADIYACWERTGDPEIRIGHITEGGEVLMNNGLLRHWRARNVVSNPVCRKCRYATSCGGGCAMRAEDASGDIYTNHCDGFAKRFRASVAAAFLAHLRGERRESYSNRLCDA